MKKNYLIKVVFLLVFALTSSTFVKAQDISEFLSLDEMNFFVHRDGSDEWDGYNVSYDPSTYTITYSYPEGGNGWGWAGWDFREDAGGPGSVDLSAFSSITVFINPIYEENSNLEFSIRYAGQESDNKYERGSDGATSLTIPLDGSLRSQVEYIYIKSQHSGKIEILGLTATPDGQMDLLFSDFHSSWKDGGDVPSHYDANYEAIVFSGDGRWIDWGYGNDGRNYSDYDYVRIDFSEPSDFDVTIEINYNPENQYPATFATAPAGSEFVAACFNKEVPGEYERTDRDDGSMGGGIRDIYIRVGTGSHNYLFVDRAYVAKGDCPEMPSIPKADLVVLDVYWEPVDPQPGDYVTFFAKVKNIGDKATEGNTKHGCVFQIWNNDTQEYQTVTWSDNWYASVAGGEEFVVSSQGTVNGRESTGELWYYGYTGPYYVRAWINDTGDITEGDTSNNYSDVFEIEKKEVSIDLPEIKGNVYAVKGTLFVEGYPSDAKVSVYNILGQKLTANGTLQPGAYIVDVNINGKSFIHKIIVR